MRTPHSTAYIDGRVICQRMNCTLIKAKIAAIVCIRGVFYHVIGPTILSQKGNCPQYFAIRLNYLITDSLEQIMRQRLRFE